MAWLVIYPRIMKREASSTSFQTIICNALALLSLPYSIPTTIIAVVRASGQTTSVARSTYKVIAVNIMNYMCRKALYICLHV